MLFQLIQHFLGDNPKGRIILICSLCQFSLLVTINEAYNHLQETKLPIVTFIQAGISFPPWNTSLPALHHLRLKIRNTPQIFFSKFSPILNSMFIKTCRPNLEFLTILRISNLLGFCLAYRH